VEKRVATALNKRLRAPAFDYIFWLSFGRDLLQVGEPQRMKAVVPIRLREIEHEIADISASYALDLDGNSGS